MTPVNPVKPHHHDDDRAQDLLRPISLGSLDLPNRVVMGSMHIGLEDHPKAAPAWAEFFATRARGGVGLMITGGISPDERGRLTEHSAAILSEDDIAHHRVVTDAVHRANGRIAIQLLHAGRYGAHKSIVSASATQAPINPIPARAMTAAEITETVASFGRAAQLAQRAGYDAIEIMGSEGYLINQFLAERTNHRDDEWGGDSERRRRFAVAVMRTVREAVGPDFPVIFRQSLLDLVEGGQTWDETIALSHELVDAGVTAINTGIGWHEAQIPTIVTSVPEAAFASVTAKLKRAVSVPVIASNRINNPATAQQLLRDGVADMVSMARPLLADPEFVRKVSLDCSDEINVCIACNQACLDHIFAGKRASCLVNPRAGFELEMPQLPTKDPKSVAVVGAGPAGLAAAVSLAERGHTVTLFEAQQEIGGQFRLASVIPGKEEFANSIAYFERRLQVLGVEVRTATRATPDDLAGFDRAIIATGVTPRVPDIPGVDLPHVVRYDELLRGEKKAGQNVVVLGGGGIGFDVCEYLLHGDGHELDANEASNNTGQLAEWRAVWGVTDPDAAPAGLTRPQPMRVNRSGRTVTMLQRSTNGFGSSLGKTTGWVHKATLKMGGVKQIGGVRYDRITAEGIAITVTDETGEHQQFIAADTIVLCTGQESVREFSGQWPVVGGAYAAAGIDAKGAIRQATEVADALR